ncbi:hypothetical protein BRADI_2g17922v3 [Brachypodium distachyon]|uniref:RNase H type-1 domain-containing protein n=1 Tax=Brachypodium distachyon TaxID=15368 RepID=A0A2K2D923_BRADI|nr:hypothetical protein BRADI_2g17922v3 [Brachypodium distachyon]
MASPARTAPDGIRQLWDLIWKADVQPKLNVDASFSNSSGFGSWGAVLCNHDGSVVGSAWAGGINASDDTTMETIAALEGLRSLHHLISRLICIESDSLRLVKEFDPSGGYIPQHCTIQDVTLLCK